MNNQVMEVEKFDSCSRKYHDDTGKLVEETYVVVDSDFFGSEVYGKELIEEVISLLQVSIDNGADRCDFESIENGMSITCYKLISRK